MSMARVLMDGLLLKKYVITVPVKAEQTRKQRPNKMMVYRSHHTAYLLLRHSTVYSQYYNDRYINGTANYYDSFLISLPIYLKNNSMY